jgi:sulfatase maturation enzyme AslB (radical SAM superfamily)
MLIIKLIISGRAKDVLEFLVAVTITVNAKCHDCPWSVRCSAGCRVGALAQGNGLDGIDERICTFYESGCYMKLKEIAGKFGIET